MSPQSNSGSAIEFEARFLQYTIRLPIGKKRDVSEKSVSKTATEVTRMKMKDMLEAHRAWGPRSPLGNTSFDSHVARPPVQHVVTAPTLPSPVYTAVVIRKCIFH